MENFGHAHSVVRHEIPPAAQASMRSKHKLHRPASKKVNEILQIACSGGCAAELLTTFPPLQLGYARLLHPVVLTVRERKYCLVA